jgi:tetratricopeptide (TPR) repeat protein
VTELKYGLTLKSNTTARTFKSAALAVVLSSLFAAGALVVSAHDGLHEQLAEVSARLRRDPRNASLYLKRGELYRLHREWRRAAADYDRAARLDPRLAAVDFARGRMLFEAGRAREAKSALDRFLRAEPRHAEALATRARVLVRLGRRAEAAQDFTRALALAPEPDLFVERAAVLAAAGGEHAREALGGLDEGVARLGPLVTLQLPAIELELREGRYDAALARLDTVAARAPRQESWLARRGDILLRAGRTEEARAAYAAALAALETLPAPRRRTRAVAELEAHVRAALVKKR